ncbi:MAG: hypothetical protein LN413_05710 [Candidatus Thermoplasmatota archaeon]|nr:hypothetical protein [Candidatus Thermoplasmatota archaeon]
MVKKWYRSRNADIGSIETKDELDDLGSQAPGAGGIDTDVNAKFVRRVIIAAGIDGAAVGSVASFARLEGDGMENSEQLLGPGFSVPVATGTSNRAPAQVSPILNFPVNGGSPIKLYADSEADAESDLEFGVTLELVDAKIPKSENDGAEIRTRLFSADVDAVDSDVDLTPTQGSNSKPNKRVPDGVSVLRYLKAIYATDEGADGSHVIFVRLKGDWIDQQPHTIMVAGGGAIAGQSGSDEPTTRVEPFFLDDMNIPVSPGSTIEVDGEQAGDDMGSGQIAVELGFA